MESTCKKKGLFAFDFDHTIVDANSDIEIMDLIPDKVVPPDIQVLYTEKNWTDYMQAVFKHMHSKGVTSHKYKAKLSSLPFCQDLPLLIQWLNESGFEVIIISDSNSFFINHVLEDSGLSDVVTKVFTNPAYFDSDDLLHVEWYHSQDYCSLSTVNMCKGQILEDYINSRKKENVTFDKILYCGDGSNDFCPSLRLSEGDFTFPRIGFKLNTKLKEAETNLVKAKIVPWKTGQDILDFVKTL